MQKVFILERTGYIEIGETIESDGKLYVITNVVNLVEYMSEDRMKIRVIAQEYGTKSVLHEFNPWYGEWDGYQRRYPGGVETEENPFLQVGDVVPLSFEQDGLLGYISKIFSVTYTGRNYQDLIMTCSVQVFPVWSDEDMRRAAKKKRLTTFKLIGKNS